MGKEETFYVCQQCGAKTLKWVGKCPICGAWNSMVETIEEKKVSEFSAPSFVNPLLLSQIKSFSKNRISTGIREFDQVLGGGIVPGSVVLIAGEPGIGKSTLLLQLAAHVGGVYVSGEESLSQIKIRAERLKIKTTNLFFLSETDIETIIYSLEQFFKKEEPPSKIVVVDSIQTLYSPQLGGGPGSVGQVRECTNKLLRLAKENEISLFIVGHVTKEGVIAGPKVLEHAVDTVLYLEGERFGSARLLRVVKNRFGPTDEVGVFQMTERGMEEVENPSALFLADRAGKVPGSVVSATIEGTRPLLVEIQGLVVSTNLALPRRVGQGIDVNRLQMIIAVLTKILRFPLGNFDIYVNVTGGLKIKEPAADLGVALAIVSSFKNVSLPPKTVCWGELGLLGEIREVSQSQRRQKESRRLGFTNILSPANSRDISSLVKRLF